MVLTAVNAWGYTLSQSYAIQQPPVEGSSLVLTIDTHIQRYLENALGYAVQEHSAAARGVGIVLDVNTGAVLAMATTPAYDPNQPRVVYDPAARAAVRRPCRASSAPRPFSWPSRPSGATRRSVTCMSRAACSS